MNERSRAPALLRRLAEGFKALAALGCNIAVWGLVPVVAAIAQSAGQASGDALLQEVVVSASRISRPGFEAPTPVSTVTSAELEQTGTTNIATYLNQLPSFSPSITPATQTLSTTNTGAFLPDLRGLGPNRTLVLVNGRRFVPTNGQGNVDLNSIPAAAIDRVDVVTGGASSAWGSDAIAGVINVIFNNKLNGLRSDIQYGSSEHGDARNYRGSLAVGSDVADGRGHVLVAAEFNRDDGIDSQRDRSWSAQQWARIPNPLHLVPGDGQPATIIRPGVSLNVATYGGLILGPDPLTNIDFGPGGSVSKLQSGSLVSTPYMVGGNGASFGADAVLSSPYERKNLLTSFSYAIAPAIDVFFEGSYSERNTTSRTVESFDIGSIVIQADNPFIPAQVRSIMQANGIPAFVMGRLNKDLGFITSDLQYRTYRAVIGLDGKFGESWTWDAYYDSGRTQHENRQFNNRIQDNFSLAVDAVTDPATGRPVCRASLNASLPAGLQDTAARCVPIDLFGPGAPSAAAINYVNGTGLFHQETTESVAAATLRGDLAQLWAGPLSLAAGAEHRHEGLVATADDISKNNGFIIVNNQPIDGAYSVNEVFAEGALPVLKDVAFAQRLELNGAVRSTDYSGRGSVRTWKVGSIWKPVPSLRFRGTYSKDIRAPNLSELFAPSSLSFFSPSDPCDATSQAGNASYAARCRAAGIPANFQSSAALVPQPFSGNAALANESAETKTIGFVFEGQDRLANARAMVDWFDINIKEAINLLDPQVILNLCYSGDNSACTLIDRGANHQLTHVRSTYLNQGRDRARGIDAELQYGLSSTDPLTKSPARTTVRLVTTWLDSKTITPDGVTTQQLAGSDGPDQGAHGGLPHWRFNLSADYQAGPFSVYAQTRFVGGGKIDTTLTSADLDHNSIAGVWYLDISGRYRLNVGSAPLEIYAGINNVMDKDPPIMPTSSIDSIATNAGLYDIVGRFFYVGMRVRL